jgi:Spy/CpxP family protein refolding chaperone
MRRLTLLALAAAATLAASACTSPTAPSTADQPGVNLECKGETNGSSTKC